MDRTVANDAAPPSGAKAEGEAPLCRRCEEESLRPEWVSTAIWCNDALVVVRNIPAMICPACGEEFVGGRTARGLDRMRDGGFPPERAAESMIVPVFDYMNGLETR